MAEEQGVVYLLCGRKCAARLVVSVYSLRQHYDGPVTICTTTAKEEKLMRRTAKDLDCELLHVEKVAGKNEAQSTKPWLPEFRLYDKTVYLDADTIITGTFDALFKPKIALTQFADWTTQTGRLPFRFREWRKIAKDKSWVDRILQNPFPLLNTGVFGWHHSSDLFLWKAIASDAGSDARLVDEIAMQIAMPMLKDVEILDDRFNCSVIYGLATEDIRIWHFHSQAHLRDFPASHELWRPCFREVCEHNIGNLSEWAGNYDRRIRGWLKAIDDVTSIVPADVLKSQGIDYQ